MTDRELAREAMDLKALDRAGWKRAGVPHPESVAAHSWGVALLALLRCPEGLDRHKLLAMAILHDLAEVRVGDLTPHDGVSKEEKHHRERTAMDALLAHRPDLRAIWDEAEAGVSPEARLLKELDRAEMGTQALAYGDAGFDVSELLASAAGSMHTLG
ncbi:MAG: HD domain-containing protein [Pseudomonadota bacterium]|nr:HD domain-containing protein [Pseudomonadota bacterium]